MSVTDPAVDENMRSAIVRETDHALDTYGGDQLDQALSVLVNQARILVGAHQAALSYIPDADFRFAVHSVSLSEKYEKYRAYDVMPTGQGIWAAVMEQKIPFCLNEDELVNHPQWRNFSDLKNVQGLEHPPMRGWLAVPILNSRQAIVGILQLSDKFDGDFDSRDLAMLTHLAKLIGPTFELQGVARELQRRTAEQQEERRTAISLAQEADNARWRAEQVEERLNLALKSSGVGTWNWNVVENSIIWDDFIHPLFGLAPGTFPGRYEAFVELLHPDDRERVATEVAEAVEKDVPYDTEYRVIWPDLSIHALGSRGRVYRDSTGHALRMTGVCWDITERKDQEAEIARQHDELARSNQELEQFAYVASHDLQEPLRKIQAFADMLTNHVGTALDDEARDYLNRMQNAATRMRSLINDLLSFSRVKSQPWQSVQVDLNRIVHEVLSDLETSAAETGARLEIGQLPAIQSDPLQMRMLFQNLIGNALKFRRAGVAPFVTVRARVLKPGEIRDSSYSIKPEWCELTVQDNGIGFERKYAERIFTPFQRLHGKAAYEGTGIGLAICRRIVERHGGHITADSSPENGTRMIVLLPCRQGNDPRTEHDSRAKP